MFVLEPLNKVLQFMMVVSVHNIELCGYVLV